MRVAAVLVLALTVAVSAAANTTARRPAPAVAGIGLDGKPVSLAKLRGKPVFINVWSSW